MCRNRLEIIAAARSLSVRGQPIRKTDRPPLPSHRVARAERCSFTTRSSHPETKVRTDDVVQVDDQLFARREAEAIPRERLGRRATDDTPVLVVAAAMTRAFESGTHVPDIAAKMRADRRNAEQAVGAVE